jgi:hypothetical protein
MFKKNKYNEEDFSQDYTLYKGKERDITLSEWTFDRFNQCFYKEKNEYIVSIIYDGKWTLTLCRETNVSLHESYYDLADAFTKGNDLI